MDETFKFTPTKQSRVELEMGIEIDLLKNYPKTKRNINERLLYKSNKDREIARKFGKEFFDGHRKNGYGGFHYNPRFWEPVIPTFQEFYNLKKGNKILDIGCAKGFMLYDFSRLITGINIAGIDISEYAIQNSLDDVKNSLKIANAKSLPYEDNSFDLVISINSIHNLDRDELIIALQEIQRVSKKFSFITVDAYRNSVEKKAMDAWNLTAKTILSTDEWVSLFDEIGYTGDYYWFTP